MKQLTYAMQFKGSAAPKDDANPSVLGVKSTGKSVGNALDGNLVEAARADFEGTVRMMEEGTFEEDGTISFGNGNSLRFSTLNKGHVAPSPEPGLTAGAIIWKIDGGEGQFAGATGLITSNFFFNEAGEVTANQFGVIFAPRS